MCLDWNIPMTLIQSRAYWVHNSGFFLPPLCPASSPPQASSYQSYDVKIPLWRISNHKSTLYICEGWGKDQYKVFVKREVSPYTDQFPAVSQQNAAHHFSFLWGNPISQHRIIDKTHWKEVGKSSKCQHKKGERCKTWKTEENVSNMDRVVKC